MFIVTELCEGKDLFQVYCKKNKVVKEYDASVLAKTLIKTLIHCHTNNIIHRDLKLENIMFTSEDQSDFSKVKLIDFGLAAKVPHKFTSLSVIVGSPYFTAPEVFEEKYDEK